MTTVHFCQIGIWQANVMRERSVIVARIVPRTRRATGHRYRSTHLFDHLQSESEIGSTFANCRKSSSAVSIESRFRMATAQMRKSVLEP